MSVKALLVARGSRSFARLSLRLFDGSAPRRQKSSSTFRGDLAWETFDYSDSPKWDARFNDTRVVVASNQQELDEIIQEETKEDRKAAERLDRYWNALQSLSPQLVADATRVLEPYVKPERLDRINQVLGQRTRHCRFLFENPANPSNVWACLRTLDSFGVQHVDLVIQSGKYTGKAALAQKRGVRTSMGSAQWLSIRNHLSTSRAVEKLKQAGYKIYASDLNPNSIDIRQVDWDQDDQPICIVMGNENDGISQEMRGLADETFTLPMVGFAESFNLSVATAIALAHLSACSKGGKGPLRPGDLDEHEFNCLRLKGIMNSLAQKRTGKALLKREGIVLPPELEWV
jgi:tRNA G18 (ribose-2'-O)-methylase SpoU